MLSIEQFVGKRLSRKFDVNGAMYLSDDMLTADDKR